MIIVEIEGRLGNQLFQYAFAKSLGYRLGAMVLIDEPHHKFDLPNFFQLRNFNALKNKLLRKIYRHRLRKKSVSNNECPKDVLNDLTNGTIYSGFFQSEKYFQTARDSILEEFVPHQKFILEYEKYFKKGVRKSKNRLITIHVRGTDYLNYGSHLLPRDFYANAIKVLEIEDDEIINVVTDDYEYAKSLLKGLGEFKFHSESMMTDFQLLQNSDLCIISNSTFAWWAAYLNRVNGAKILAPKYWLGINNSEEYPSGIMTDRFNWI